MIQIRRERWDQIYPECEALMKQQAEEIYGSGGKPIIIDDKTVHWLEANGGLLILAARENERLVGYITWIIAPDLESAGRKVATAGPWYVVPECRARGVGRDLMQLSEIALAEWRIKELHAHAPAVHGVLASFASYSTPLGKWFESNGWSPRQMQYTKKLNLQ